MSAKKSLYASPETYLSGMTALSIPDEGRIGGDWHFAAALCDPRVRLQSAGARGNLTDTNAIFGHRWVHDKAQILRERGIEITEDHVYCASHPRAVADLLHHALARNIFPAHVSLDGGIFEEVVEFDQLEELLAAMIPHLAQTQVDDLLRWKGSHFYPAKEGVSVDALTFPPPRSEN